MTDKKKIRNEVEKLKSQLIRGACSSQIAMETRCKEEAYNEVISLLDSLQEEPNISPVFDEGYWERLGEKSASKEIGDYDHKAVDEALHPQLKDKGYRERYKRIAQSEAFKRTHEGRSVGEIMHVEGEECISEIDFGQELYKAFGQVKDFTLGLQIAKRFYDMGKNHQEPVSEQNLSNVERIGKDWKEEPVSEDLEEAASSFARKDSEGISNPANFYYTVADKMRIFKAGAQWQKEQFEKNRLAACDRQTEEEAEIELDFVMSIIENEHRQPTFDDAIKYGIRLHKEQVMAKAIDGVVTFDYYGNYVDDDKTYGCIAHDSFCLEDFGLKDKDKVKMILIKED